MHAPCEGPLRRGMQETGKCKGGMQGATGPGQNVGKSKGGLRMGSECCGRLMYRQKGGRGLFCAWLRRLIWRCGWLMQRMRKQRDLRETSTPCGDSNNAGQQ